jgi:hypothetical protein
MAGRPKPGTARFGIGEWYGSLAVEMPLQDRIEAVKHALSARKEGRPPCPFKPPVRGQLQSCSKSGGVCSLRLYNRSENGEAMPENGPTGALRCVCPNRFLEDGMVHRWIAAEILGTDEPLSVGEVPFLRAEHQGVEDEIAEESGNVGRIDSVLVHPDVSHLRWCAVEMQAVYFSGPAMNSDYDLLRTSQVMPFPGKTRRPDYRSSGPKRLMPQLQIKVPTLRRWGKKMAVVVDESFFEALGRMDDVSDVSNADIAWFVVGFELGSHSSKLVKRKVRYTTLERAVEGLTAGHPMSLGQFESEIEGRLSRVIRSEP